MIRRLLLVALAGGMLMTGYALILPSAEAADAATNLKVLPKTMSKQEVKKVMKEVAKSLGLQCDFCHDTEDFAKDTEHKEIARGMMRMTADLNKKYFKGKPRVTCMTCHGGKEHPKK